MPIGALATDYDGTLAREGVVAPATVAALERFKASGRKLLLVTGRELPDLKRVFPELAICDGVVAENGALLYWPRTGEERRLAPGPPPELVQALRDAGVQPLNVGRVIVATAIEYEAAVEQAILATGVAWRAIRNKDSVMVLPVGVDKASGLAAVLAVLDIPPAEVLAVGDAENDKPLLAAAGLSAAVANALPELKAAAQIVTRGADGDGVIELIERVLEDARRATPARQDAGTATGPAAG